MLAEGWREMSLADQRWLRAALETPFEGTTVAVTHFAPSLRSADPRYGLVPGTAGFCNSMDDFLPLAWRTVPSGMSSLSGAGVPSSSRNSRRATSIACSPGSISPFGIDHAPSSFRIQNGPPGWMRSTSSSSPRRR